MKKFIGWMLRPIVLWVLRKTESFAWNQGFRAGKSGVVDAYECPFIDQDVQELSDIWLDGWEEGRREAANAAREM